jgi:hypothetical protein
MIMQNVLQVKQKEVLGSSFIDHFYTILSHGYTQPELRISQGFSWWSILPDAVATVGIQPTTHVSCWSGPLTASPGGWHTSLPLWRENTTSRHSAKCLTQSSKKEEWNGKLSESAIATPQKTNCFQGHNIDIKKNLLTFVCVCVNSFFKIGSCELLPNLPLNHDHPDLCLLSN